MVIAIFRQVAGVGAVLLLLVVGGCQAVPQEVVQLLPEAQARELAVYSKNHAVIFDLRIHSMDTCPFLTYMPNSMSMDHNSKEWAAWLLQFYRAKHQEEHSLYNCKCEQELRAPPAEPGSSAGKCSTVTGKEVTLFRPEGPKA